MTKQRDALKKWLCSDAPAPLPRGEGDKTETAAVAAVQIEGFWNAAGLHIGDETKTAALHGTPQSLHDSLPSLHDTADAVIIEHLRTWEAAQNEESPDREKPRTLYQRYAQLVKTNNSGGNTVMEPGEQLYLGFRTANAVFGSLMDVALQLFHERHPARELDEATLRSLYESIMSIVHIFAAQHMKTLDKTTRRIADVERLFGMKKEFFDMREENGKCVLVLREAAVPGLGALDPDATDAWTGCPALFAHDTDGRNLIRAFCDSCWLQPMLAIVGKIRAERLAVPARQRQKWWQRIRSLLLLGKN